MVGQAVKWVIENETDPRLVDAMMKSGYLGSKDGNLK